MHFNKSYDEKYFQMLTSEKRVMTMQKGQTANDMETYSCKE